MRGFFWDKFVPFCNRKKSSAIDTKDVFEKDVPKSQNFEDF
jgi:hypothetical protein